MRVRTAAAAKIPSDETYCRSHNLSDQHLPDRSEPEMCLKPRELPWGRRQVEIVHEPAAPRQRDPRLFEVKLPWVDIDQAGFPGLVQATDLRHDVEVGGQPQG
jgi:hypothetical protein